MSRVITSTLNQTVAYWLQGGMSCHCSLAKCCVGSRLNVAQERLADFDGHQNFVSFLQLLFLSRFASFLILFIPKGNGKRNFLLYTLSQNCDRRLLASSCLEQPDSHWTDIHEILYFYIFSKIFRKIKVSLKCDKSNGYLTSRTLYIYDSVSLNSFGSEKYLRQKL